MSAAPSGPENRCDIRTSADIGVLVRRFYQAAIPDDLLGPVFRAAGIDWGVHVPVVREFWNHQILGESGYRGNVVRAHTEIMSRAPFGPVELQGWLELFEETVDEYFAGPGVERAKRRANEVADAIGIAMARRSRAAIR